MKIQVVPKRRWDLHISESMPNVQESIDQLIKYLQWVLHVLTLDAVPDDQMCFVTIYHIPLLLSLVDGYSLFPYSSFHVVCLLLQYLAHR